MQTASIATIVLEQDSVVSGAAGAIAEADRHAAFRWNPHLQLKV
jgi:hypothetical protein